LSRERGAVRRSSRMLHEHREGAARLFRRRCQRRRPVGAHRQYRRGFGRLRRRMFCGAVRAQPEGGARSPHRPAMSTKFDATQSVSNLRLPVPFFDLLMVLLVTCLVFVAPFPSEDGKTQAMDISVAQGTSTPSAESILPVVPRHDMNGWTFALADGQQFSPG